MLPSRGSAHFSICPCCVLGHDVERVGEVSVTAKAHVPIESLGVAPLATAGDLESRLGSVEFDQTSEIRRGDRDLMDGPDHVAPDEGHRFFG